MLNNSSFTFNYRAQHSPSSLNYSSVFRVGFDAIPPAMLQNNWFMLLAVHYRVMEYVGSLESTQEARVML